MLPIEILLKYYWNYWNIIEITEILLNYYWKPGESQWMWTKRCWQSGGQIFSDPSSKPSLSPTLYQGGHFWQTVSETIFDCLDQSRGELCKWCSNPYERPLHRRPCHPLPRFPYALLCLYSKGDKNSPEIRNISCQSHLQENISDFLFEVLQGPCSAMHGRQVWEWCPRSLFYSVPHSQLDWGGLYYQAFWTGGASSLCQWVKRAGDWRTVGAYL